MEKRYIVVDEPKHPYSGDSFQTVHRTAEEANEAADREWWYLTTGEKKRRHVYVGVVTETDLDPDEVEEYGLDNDRAWLSYTDLDGFPGAFDSESEGNDDD